jgi:tetratricopeptide (TPR) repeat protein
VTTVARCTLEIVLLVLAYGCRAQEHGDDQRGADADAPAEHTATTDACRGTSSAVQEAHAALERGLDKVHAEDPAGAIADLTRAIELDPTLATAFNWRGHCLNLLGMPDQALADYDHAIALQPDYAWSHYARAMANHNLRRYDAAIDGYTRAIELDPTFVKAWHWRGFTRKLVGDYAGSVADLRRGLEIQPDDPWAQSELAKAEQALGRFDECQAALERLVALDATNGSAHAELGFLFAVRGDVARSIAELGKACDLKAPEETYARIWTWMQRTDRAAADATLRAWLENARIDDPWELQVAAFLLGEATDEQLAERAAVETEGRVARGAPPDFLACEAAFYAGLRHELAGERDAAIGMYAKAHAEPGPEAWEWSMAAVRAHSLGR